MGAAASLRLLDDEIARAGRFSLKAGSTKLGFFGMSSDGRRLLTKDPPARMGIPSIMLLFPNPAAATAVLTGSPGGSVIPIPGSGAAGRALSFFKAAGRRVSALIAGTADTGDGSAVSPGDTDASRKGAVLIRASLLLQAVARGIVEVANHDPAAAPRRAHMGFGTVELLIEGETPYSVLIDARQPQLSVSPPEPPRVMRGAIPARPGDPSVRLSFTDPQTAVDVLTGAMSAVVALGTGAVRMRGRVPLVQNLFSILDLLSGYLSGVSRS
jgi:hypothetical protein